MLADLDRQSLIVERVGECARQHFTNEFFPSVEQRFTTKLVLDGKLKLVLCPRSRSASGGAAAGKSRRGPLERRASSQASKLHPDVRD